MADVDEIARIIQRQAGNIQLSAMKRAEGKIKQRVFNRGEATNGTPLGPYKSVQHKKLRRAKGRQTGYKDLQLDGDLFRSFVTGEIDNKAALGFSTNKQRIIAQGQTQQVGKDIFNLSRDEFELIERTILAEVNAILNAR